MSQKSVYHLDIVIDHLTNSIRNRISGQSLSTEIIEVTKTDLLTVKKKKGEWQFDWKDEFRQSDRKVYKLTIAGQPDIIQGLVSISDMKDHFYLHLAKSAPMNFGENKVHEGVGGNLFAFCCKHSWDNGNEGFIAFKAKTKLIAHYEQTLGAKHIGNHNMIIYSDQALILIKRYFNE